MALDRDLVKQNIFGENYFPLEILERLKALADGVPGALARAEIPTAPLSSEEFETIVADLELGARLYTEAHPFWLRPEELREVNHTFKSLAGLVYVSFSPPTQVNVQVYRPTLAEAREELVRIIGALPKPRVEKKPDKEMVEMAFWMSSANGPVTVARKIDVQAFHKIEENYTANVREALHWTMAYRPEEDARLFLFHGVPGTGKTHAIRSMAWEWRRWAKFHYITDPEAFFNTPAYMFQVLSTPNGRMLNLAEDEEDEDDDEVKLSPAVPVLVNGVDKLKWTVLILEDCGELIAADAKDRTGQGLSRLLNMVDGLLGQGMKVLVLITTNEPVEKLNQAVIRAGRCAQQVEFAALTASEAAEWLKPYGLEGPGGERTIADLFAQRRDEAPKHTLHAVRKVVGFK